MPNTRVDFRSALVGGLSGGILWATLGMIFAAFIANSARNQTIYASFAIAITTLIWLYLNWLILLIGSQIAFYFQNPAYLRIGRRDPRLSNSMRERLALNIMFLVGKEFREPAEGVTLSTLSSQLRIPSITLAPIATSLETSGFLTSNEKESLLPGREMSRITLIDIVAVVRLEGETGSHQDPRWSSPIEMLGKGLDTAVADTLSDKTLAQLLDESVE
jgi:membrane protein